MRYNRILTFKYFRFSALLEFLEPSEARKAFTKLAYTKFKHLPLYLEWAPDNSFINKLSKSDKSKSKNDLKNKLEEAPVETKGVGKEDELNKNQDKNKEIENENDDEPEPDTTIFVKNLNFSTSESTLKEVSTSQFCFHARL